VQNNPQRSKRIGAAAVPSRWDRELRALKSEHAYMTAALSLPLVAPWVHHDQSEPITPVLRHRAASPGPRASIGIWLCVAPDLVSPTWATFEHFGTPESGDLRVLVSVEGSCSLNGPG
jgi:hypothetical protein